LDDLGVTNTIGRPESPPPHLNLCQRTRGTSIVEYPDTVYQLSPVPFVVEVTNSLDEVVRNDGDEQERWFLEVGTTPEEMSPAGEVWLLGGAWTKPSLQPDEKWYYLRDLAYYVADTGTYYVRAVAWLEPLCGQVRRLDTEEQKIACAGRRVESELAVIQVIKPPGAMEQRVYDYIASDEFPYQWGGAHPSAVDVLVRLRQRALDVRTRFPESHYTLAATLGSKGYVRRPMLDEMNVAHVGHPLLRCAQFRWAESTMRLRLSPDAQQRLDVAPNEMEIAVDELDLGEGFKRYLEQYDWTIQEQLLPREATESHSVPKPRRVR
jgi:hypothetical protein